GHPGRDRRYPVAGALRHRPGHGLPEGPRQAFRHESRRLQHGPLGQHRRPGPGRPPGRADPSTAQPAGDRQRPAQAHREIRPMSLVTTLSYVLPHRLLSSMARSLAYSQNPRISRWLIDTVTEKFNVNLAEAANSDPRSYASFNAFFTRALKAGARVPAADPRTLTMPADGHISQLGAIEDGRIFQAKGQSFTATELLGDATDAAPFRDGLFATVYLSPRDYHRVHMPWTGTLRETVHVPGRLF